MSASNDGGPAFPCGTDTGNDRGISVRAYLAAKAMNVAYHEEMTFEAMAVWNCKYADAMIAELEKEVEAPEEVKATLPPGLQREPKFNLNDKVRVVENSRFRGMVGTVESSVDEPIHGWVHKVSFPMEIAGAIEVFGEGDLEAAGEKPKPEFKVGDSVRVRAGIGIFAGKAGIVEAAFKDTIGEGFKYRVHITDDAMRETYYECQLEAVGEEVKELDDLSPKTPLPKVRWTPLNKFIAEIGTPLKAEGAKDE